VREDCGTISAPIGRSAADRKKMAVGGLNAKEAVTHFEVLARWRGYTHLQLRLETGRTHQIRVHLASRGTPILGDMVYGRKKPELGLSSQCLHARRISFVHPRSGETITLSCDLPGYFLEVLQKLGPPKD
jgi:23S rRNA pseudouridine1911/1915/1917 synthase